MADNNADEAKANPQKKRLKQLEEIKLKKEATQSAQKATSKKKARAKKSKNKSNFASKISAEIIDETVDEESARGKDEEVEDPDIILKTNLMKALQHVEESQVKITTVAKHSEAWFKKYNAILDQIEQDLEVFELNQEQNQKQLLEAMAQLKESMVRDAANRAKLKSMYGETRTDVSRLLTRAASIGIQACRTVLYALAKVRDRAFREPVSIPNVPS
ncbi:unnamed protein product [Caenorhabditis auriculariae]|uniref:Uncharacterized protein n=1 Tax=Caenorhabditis auriculariae TaxID=2777116 RepID=A0A8S1GV10_9PELO|nr:unnamed protein product [Caenorhabditis auriculariae]